MKKNNVILTMAITIMLCATIAIPFALDEAEEVEAIPALVTFGIGMAIGFTLGYYVGNMLSDPSDGSLDDTINDNYKQLELKNIRSVIISSNAMAGAILPTDVDMLSFTSDHWNRVMEYSVANAWSLDANIDQNALLESNMTQASLSTYLYNWQHALDNSYGQIGAQQLLWDQYDIYDDCIVSLDHDNGTLWNRTKGEAGDRLDFVTAVTSSTDANKVYLRAVNDNGDSFTNVNDKNLYVFGSGTAKLTTKNGLFVELAPGVYDIGELTLSDGSALKSTTYTVTTNDTIIAGAFSSAGNNAAEVSGAMVTQSGSSINLVRAADHDLEIISLSGNTETTTDLQFNLNYIDKDSAVQNVNINDVNSTKIGDILHSWNDMQQKVAELVDGAAIAGNVLWTLYDTAETARDEDGNLVYLAPSSIIPQNVGITLSPEVQIAMSIAALRQAASYYSNNATALDSMRIDISLNSSDIVCYGNIWSNGILIAENAVYSPYTYERALTLTAGTTIKMNQAGVALVYGNTDDLDSFLLAPAEGLSLLPLSSGMSFETKRIISNGIDVETFDLTLNRVIEHTTSIPDPIGPTAPVALKDISQLFILISILLAIILLLLGYVTGNRILMVVGVIIGVIGIIISDWMMRVYLGYEGPFDWIYDSIFGRFFP